MVYKFFPLVILSFFAFTYPDTHRNTDPTDPKLVASHSKKSFESSVTSMYQGLQAGTFTLPAFECFSTAMEGYFQLKSEGIVQKEILTLIDFSLSANSKRLWIIDMQTMTVLYHTLVAHGKNTGDEFATHFSNKAESYQSSLGFYTTGESYIGKHGMSLRLDGLEKGINDQARSRAIVIHGAEYVSEEFIQNHGRLGRSLGCPALPVGLTREIIDLIKDQSCLFIYHSSGNYRTASKLVS